MNRPKIRLVPAMIVASVTSCTVLAVYVLSYVFGCNVTSHPHVKFRTYRTPAQVVLFTPAARVESALLGIPIELRDFSPSTEPPVPVEV